jgi:G3E family GTPase
MIPVNIVTGFLGSGKTTLLREVLGRADFADTAVIVNEFGEVGLDHLLLEEVEEGVLLLDSGCICCTIRSDLKETIRNLHDKAARGDIPRFRRIVVETTGLADPAPIVSTIAAEPVIRNHYRIGNIVCTIDGMAGMSTLDAQPEAAKQVAIADRLLLTKADLASPATLDRLARRLREINPMSPLAHSTGAAFDAEFLFSDDVGDASRRNREVQRWLDIARAHPGGSGGHAHDGTNAFVLSYPDPIDWTAFGAWLTALLHANGDRILRVKGILNVRDSETPVVLHGVQHIVHPPLHLERWPDADRSSRVVFITRGIEEARIRRSLAAFLDMAARLDGRTAAA